MQDTDPTIECCTGLKARLEDWRACAEKTVREEPAKAAACAFLAGIFFTVFPVGRVVGGLLRLAFALVRPALLIFGAVKLFEEIDRRKS